MLKRRCVIYYIQRLQNNRNTSAGV